MISKTAMLFPTTKVRQGFLSQDTDGHFYFVMPTWLNRHLPTVKVDSLGMKSLDRAKALYGALEAAPVLEMAVSDYLPEGITIACLPKETPCYVRSLEGQTTEEAVREVQRTFPHLQTDYDRAVWKTSGDALRN